MVWMITPVWRIVRRGATLSVQVDRAASALHGPVDVASLVATRARALHARQPTLMWLAEALCVLLGILAVLALLHRAPVLWLANSHGDFSVFYQAARAATAGRDPYVDPLYHYFPAFTLLLRPLGLFSLESAYT